MGLAENLLKLLFERVVERVSQIVGQLLELYQLLIFYMRLQSQLK
jgi:hypothetical protein